MTNCPKCGSKVIRKISGSMHCINEDCGWLQLPPGEVMLGSALTKIEEKVEYRIIAFIPGERESNHEKQIEQGFLVRREKGIYPDEQPKNVSELFLSLDSCESLVKDYTELGWGIHTVFENNVWMFERRTVTVTEGEPQVGTQKEPVTAD